MSRSKVEEKDKDEEKIEITPEMIEAAVRVLWKSGALETPMEDFDRSLVQKIFVAMVRARESRS